MSRQRQWFLITLLLVSAVFTSALFVIMVHHENRVLFTELQQLQTERDRLNTEWAQLRLELSTWAQPSRIETLAQKSLDMHKPTAKHIKVIHP